MLVSGGWIFAWECKFLPGFPALIASARPFLPAGKVRKRPVNDQPWFR
jgi:hypothetical protein